jgi:hypothetical protein
MQTIEDIEEVVVEMIDLIREDPTQIQHAGRLAPLVNAW